MRKVMEAAYAKVNLTLTVGGWLPHHRVAVPKREPV